MNRSPLLRLLYPLALAPLAACAIGIGTPACSLTAIQGSGVEASQVREVASFDRIHLIGSAEVVIHVGGERHVALRGDDNLLEYVTTEVQGDTLEIGMRSGSYSFRSGLRIEVEVPELSAFAISGSGEARISGLDGGEFAATITGSGDVRASGQVDHLEARLSGSGDMDLVQLQAREVRVAISGSGEVNVDASETLDVSISGSGDVSYSGQPRVSQRISGSGDVSRR